MNDNLVRASIPIARTSKTMIDVDIDFKIMKSFIVASGSQYAKYKRVDSETWKVKYFGFGSWDKLDVSMITQLEALYNNWLARKITE